jgi:hypothetical protein
VIEKREPLRFCRREHAQQSTDFVGLVTSGFYPTIHEPCLLFGCSVVGKVLDDPSDHPGVTPWSIHIHTTSKQDLAMQMVIDQRWNDPGSYKLYGRNCSRFVEDVLKAGGVKNVPDDVRPLLLFNDLRKSIGSQKN